MSTDVSCNYAKYATSNPIARYLNNGFLTSISELVSIVTPQKILDAGCGEGFVVEKINNKDIEITGLDLEEEALKVARQKNPSVTFLQGSVYELPFNDNEFDLVILSEVLEHLEEPDRGLKEVIRVSKGFCLLSVPNEPIWRVANMARLKYLPAFGNTPGHLNHWSKKSFLNLAGKHLDLVGIKTPFPWTMVLGKHKSEK